MPHRLDRFTVIMDGVPRVGDEIAHRRPGDGTRLHVARHARRPFIGVVGRLVQHDAGRLRRSGDHAQRLRESGSGVVRRCVERGEQLRQVGLQLLTPRQRLRHVIDAAGDRAELVSLIFG